MLSQLEYFTVRPPERFLDPVGVNMAIVTDAILEKGWTVDGYHQLDGYRLYRNKHSE